MRKLLVFVVTLFLIMVLTGCFGKKSENKKVDYSKQAVCILDKASIREEPSKKAKWLSSLAVGETMTFEGEPVEDKDDPKTKYLKVNLSDGTSGYVNTYTVITGAYVGVISKAAPLYKRPDLLSVSERRFEMMDIIAVQEESEGFCLVVGENRSKSGWIEKGSFKDSKEDVVTAVMLRKALKGREKTITSGEIHEIVNNLPYPSNYFAVQIIEKYSDQEYESLDLSTIDEYDDSNVEVESE